MGSGVKTDAMVLIPDIYVIYIYIYIYIYNICLFNDFSDIEIDVVSIR